MVERELYSAQEGPTPPLVLFVTDVDPWGAEPNGFRPRLRAFIDAVGEFTSVETLVLDRGPRRDGQLPISGEGFGQSKGVLRVAVDLDPLVRAGWRGRLFRLRYYLLPWGLAGYPSSLNELAELCSRKLPVLVVYYLGSTARLSLTQVHESVKICVLEEGLERRTRDRVCVTFREKAERLIVGLGESIRWRRLYLRLGREEMEFVVISEEERQWLARAVPPERIAVVPHGVDIHHFSPSGDVDERFDIGMFGAFNEERNYTAAQRIMTAACSAGYSWRWLVVGRGGERVADSWDGCHATGWVDDVRPWYEQAKVVVVPAFGGTGVKTTLLQAWSMARPVVATVDATRGVPAGHGLNALVGATAAEVVQHCGKVLGSAALAERLAGAGRATVEAQGSLDASAGEFARLCRNAIARSRFAAGGPG